MSSPLPPPDLPAHPALTGLSEAAGTIALARFRVLQPHLDDHVPLARVARAQGLELRTLQRWLRAYRQQGLAGPAMLVFVLAVLLFAATVYSDHLRRLWCPEV